MVTDEEILTERYKCDAKITAFHKGGLLRMTEIRDQLDGLRKNDGPNPYNPMTGRAMTDAEQQTVFDRLKAEADNITP